MSVCLSWLLAQPVSWPARHPSCKLPAWPPVRSCIQRLSGHSSAQLLTYLNTLLFFLQQVRWCHQTLTHIPPATTTYLGLVWATAAVSPMKSNIPPHSWRRHQEEIMVCLHFAASSSILRIHWKVSHFPMGQETVELMLCCLPL